MTRSTILTHGWLLFVMLPLAACGAETSSADRGPDPALTQAVEAPVSPHPFVATPMANFDEPWALSFLPDGRLLVSEKRGALKLFDPASSRSGEIRGVPDVAYGGQGGFGDVVPHPQFASNSLIYVSYAVSGMRDTRGAVVARAKLVLDGEGGGALEDLKVIWRQMPTVSGTGHYGHRIAFASDGKLFISSGERQHFDPAQDMKANLGKIVRLNDDGSVPSDNPFADQGRVASQIWTLGHRNPLGIAFDAQGRLWSTEMGPRGGDELNLVVRGNNYGYPTVSNGDHYSMMPIPDHDTHPEFAAPALWWTPVISPSSLMFYSGEMFPQWRGSAFAGGLSSAALIRISFDGERAREQERFNMGQRIREVEQGPDGALWLLEDGRAGRLLKLTPAK